ncbi:MAG: AsmA family protein [Granulosicoccus sp.]
MKILKRLLFAVVGLVLLLGLGVVALVYLVDWNDFKDTIQNQVKNQTGRDLQITGDLSPSVFPWAGISLGEISLANAEGYGEQPFARIGSADVKVELLPLIQKKINVRTVQLHGLQLDLQRNAEGQNNWDDLLTSTTTTSKTQEASDDAEVTTEVEGSSATIAALAVGGIEITDANISWNDAMAGTDASLSSFDLTTGAIELAKPFDLNIDFDVKSSSMDLAADVEGKGALMIDLDNQVYTVDGFELNADAAGSALPGGSLTAQLGADVVARLGENALEVSSVSLGALGIVLDGFVNITDLNTEPVVSGQFSSNDFSPREMMATLGIAEVQTADENVLTKASLSLKLNATPAAAELSDVLITLDDTRFTGSVNVPSFDAAIPPVRFDLAVDALDVDRYLPPSAEEPESAGDSGDGDTVVASTGDEPIELPVEMMRQLDIDGSFRMGELKVSNLTTRDIVIPVKAAAGRLGVQNAEAQLYQGSVNASAGINVTGQNPAYQAELSLAGIQAEPLIGDLLQKDSFLSGQGEIAADITSAGNTVNAIKASLNGSFNTAFTDGSVNGVNIGYQIRRAKAALTGGSIPPDEETVKTDFSSLAVSGTFDDGVMRSDDLDMRSPLLRLGGAGMVDLPGENVDYTLTTLITGTAQGQGGSDLDSLKGVKLDIPVRGTFSELSENFAGVLLAGMKDNITSNLRNQAKAVADQKAAELKAQAQEKADELKAQAEEAAAAKQEELKQQAEEAKDELLESAKDKLRGFLK